MDSYEIILTSAGDTASLIQERLSWWIVILSVVGLVVSGHLTWSDFATTTTTSQNMLATSAAHTRATLTASSKAQASLYALAPDFTLHVVDPNGPTEETVSLSSFRGRVVLLEFMTPWCGHCQSMAPVLEQLYEQFAPQDVVFLSVSGTFVGATVKDTVKFMNSSSSVFNRYWVTGTPTFFIIGRNGEITSTYVGAVAFEILLNDLTHANV